MYPGADKDRKYSFNDLQNLAEENAIIPVKSQHQFGEYYRDFLRIANFLKVRSRLSDRETSEWFLQGLHLQFHREVREQLRLSQPKHHPDDAWTLDEIYEAAKLVVPRQASVITNSETGTPKPTSSTVKRETFDTSKIPASLNNNDIAGMLATMTSLMQQMSNSNGDTQNKLPYKSRNCAFCSGPDCRSLRDCKTLIEYLEKGFCKRDQNNFVTTSDGSKVTFRLTPGKNMKERIDNWRKSNPSIATVSTNIIKVEGITSAHTEEDEDEPYVTQREVDELEMLQVLAATAQKKADEARKKIGNKAPRMEGPTTRNMGKVTEPKPTENSKARKDKPQEKEEATKQVPMQARSIPSSMAPQYTYVTPIENAKTVNTVTQLALDSALTISIRDLLAVSPDVRKQVKELITTKRLPHSTGTTLNVNHIPSGRSVLHKNGLTLPATDVNLIVPEHSQQLRAIDVEFENATSVEALIDNGSMIIAMRRDKWEKLGLPVRSDYLMRMQSANLTSNDTLGLLHNLPLIIGGYKFYVQVQVVEDAPYELLLGMPFFCLTEANIKHKRDNSMLLTLYDPNTNAQISVPTHERRISDRMRSQMNVLEQNMLGAYVLGTNKSMEHVSRTQVSKVDAIDYGELFSETNSKCSENTKFNDNEVPGLQDLSDSEDNISDFDEDEIPGLQDLSDSEDEFSEIDEDEILSLQDLTDAQDGVPSNNFGNVNCDIAHEPNEIDPALVNFLHGPIQQPQNIFDINIQTGPKESGPAVTISEIPVSSFAYKKVANRVKPVATTLPEDFRIVRKIPSDPLADMPGLPERPPNFTPGVRYTQERKEAMDVNKDGFLWPEEEKLVHHLIKEQEMGFAWDESEKGKFSSDYFEPVVIPTVEHIPWVLRNIPIPPGIYDQVISVIKAKIDSGIYEPSNSSYRSRWFAVPKKDGKSIRIVHDLQPLNQVAIKDAALPPHVEPYAESFGGRGCYGVFDLFVGFDQRGLAVTSRDLTTFQTPLGTFRLTSIPMGYTNSMQIQHGDTCFLLQDEIPKYTVPFIDDVTVKGPATRYELPNGGYETIPGNSGIRRFIWEHCNNVNRIIQRIKHAGGTFSGLKSTICAETAVIVGNRCTYDGRVPLESRVQKITDWPLCESLTDVRGFLGTLGTIRVFIKDYAKYAKPLVDLTRKDTPFEFGEDQVMAMQTLKHLAETCPAIRAINYDSDNEVILAVDSSWIAVGYVLSQMGDDKRRYPSRFGSITWNEREQRYSQAKIELYGLFRALKDVRLYIVGVKNLVVEVDAKYIKGMINNPDIIPNAAANRWLAGILLFNFTLRHVPGKDHAAADGLSRRRRSDNDPVDDGNIDDWIDSANCFAITVLNWDYVDPFPRNTLLQSETTGITNIDTYLPVRSAAACEIHSDDGILVSNALAQDIPQHEKSVAREAQIRLIQDFLENPVRPPSMDDLQFSRFVRQVSEFFLKGGQLWKKDRHGRHKIFVPREKRLALITQAHDDMGHKGVFSVRMNLLERFWWPFLEHDVKWFIRTCHDCQIRQMHKLHIPSSVPTPRGLFRKVYMDTMLMPKVAGFRYIVHARCSLTAWPEWTMLRREDSASLGKFIHEEVSLPLGRG